MSHIREQIRTAVADALSAGVSLVNGRVYKNRVRAYWPEELPCIAVYTQTDVVEKAGDGPLLLKRTLTLAVEVLAKADDTLDDTLDDLCEQVETVIFANQLILDQKVEVMLGDTELTFSQDGETQHGSAKLTVDAVYYQNAPEDLTGDLNNLSSIHADWNLGGDQPEADESQDVVTFGALRLLSGGLLRLQSGGGLHLENP